MHANTLTTKDQKTIQWFLQQEEMPNFIKHTSLPDEEKTFLFARMKNILDQYLNGFPIEGEVYDELKRINTRFAQHKIHPPLISETISLEQTTDSGMARIRGQFYYFLGKLRSYCCMP